ncbi:MAG: lysoplasmalogenase family protein [Hyphomonadaceae bacterium]|nr:lysoplasmalogenase family protein [Hyphomonadaceae bacterium]
MTLAVLSWLVASLICAAAYGLFWLTGPPSLARALIKTGAVGFLAVGLSAAGAHPVLVLALGLSAAGDFALAFIARAATALGIGLFLLAQLAYLVGLFFLWVFAGDLGPLWPRYGAIGAIWLFAIAWYVWLWPGLKAMAAPVALYLIAIAAMASMAMMLDWRGWPAMVGALAFLVSDAVLAAEMFRLAEGDRRRRVTPHIVWWTYYAAQLLIPLGIILVVQAA